MSAAVSLRNVIKRYQRGKQQVEVLQDGWATLHIRTAVAICCLAGRGPAVPDMSAPSVVHQLCL